MLAVLLGLFASAPSVAETTTGKILSGRVESDTTCHLSITDPVPTIMSICAGDSVTLSVNATVTPPVEIGWVRFDSEVADPYTATGNGKTYLGADKPSDGMASITTDNFPAVGGQVKTYYVYACFKYASPSCTGFVKHIINVSLPVVSCVPYVLSKTKIAKK